MRYIQEAVCPVLKYLRSVVLIELLVRRELPVLPDIDRLENLFLTVNQEKYIFVLELLSYWPIIPPSLCLVKSKAIIYHGYMRIAMLAPLKRGITPDVTASRPRVIFDLVSELVKRGHQITIFGTGDSNVPGARIVPIIPKALNFLEPPENPFYQHTAYLTHMIAKVGNDFDIIHNHMYPEFLALLRSFKIPLVTTVHAQMTQEMAETLKMFPKAHLVAISEAAKKASGREMTVIHNGIDTEFFVPKENPREYLLFVGRMKSLDPKGVLHAIAIAQKTGEKLKIVGNVEEPEFYETKIKPYLNGKIEFVGEVSSEQMLTREHMRDLFRSAKAFLFPINWEEPFGLVMAEALACGTPVLAFNRGSVSEIVRNIKNGFVIEASQGVDGFISKLSQLSSISSEVCRNDAVERFSKSRMADDYEKLYSQL